MIQLVTQIVIENVVRSKMRGKVIYQSNLSSSDALHLTYVKPYNDPSGKGYQRPVDSKRCKDFANYLSKGDDALFTPILLNSAGNWEFTPYDNYRSSHGRLICKGKASLMDGQHRLGGIKKYIQETSSEINIPFLAFHYLDDDEEVKLFDTINTKARGIGTSLSKYLNRDSDDISWISTELMVRNESPFHSIGSIIGKRSNGRHITLQNLYKMVTFLTKDPKISILSKEEKLLLSLYYFNSIKETLPQQWENYKEFRLTHIVCLDALSITGSFLLAKSIDSNKNIDHNLIIKNVKKLKRIDWSVDGTLKYLKGISGSKSLASDLRTLILPEA